MKNHKGRPLKKKLIALIVIQGINKVEGFVRAPVYYGVTELTGNAVTIRFGLFTIGWMRARMRRAFLREFKLLLDSYNIRIPYDQIHNSEM